MTKKIPLHEHDCDHCLYLGSDDTTDYYYHDDKEPVLATLIARYGAHGDYSSGTEFIMPSIGLNKALQLGYEQNLLPKAYLKQCYYHQKEWFDYTEKDPGYAAGIAHRWEGRTRFVLPDLITS